MLKAVTAGALALSAAGSMAGSQDLRPGAGVVRVTGTTLVRDGKPWVPHGVVQIAFVAPPAAQQGVFATAYRNYSPHDYAHMRQMGIDSVRIQASQPGLDPQGRLFDPEFRDRFVGAVRAARRAGLTVLVSVQDEKQSGEPAPVDLPDDATGRVWHLLAPLFADDRGVLFELLNEPRPTATPRNWQAWADAMDRMIAIVRGAGAGNTVVADGLLSGERLEGAPALADPLHQVIYASHPYAHDAAGQTAVEWDRKFGDFARTHPVIVTEWTTSRNFYCDVDTAASASAFLRYLGERRIGLMAFAWDFAGTRFGSAFQSSPAQPTDYVGKACGQDGFGPGKLFLQHYNRDRVASPPTSF